MRFFEQPWLIAAAFGYYSNFAGIRTTAVLVSGIATIAPYTCPYPS